MNVDEKISIAVSNSISSVDIDWDKAFELFKSHLDRVKLAY